MAKTTHHDYVGELYAQIQQRPLPLPTYILYAAQMVAILQCLRNAGVVHRDFKPENLMINLQGHLVLVDFGSARWLHGDGSTAPAADGSTHAGGISPTENTTTSSFVGTAEYTAPETLAGRPPTAALDLWALGCVLFQLLTGVPPFKGPTEFATFERITSGEYKLPNDVDARAADVVRRLLVTDPGARLGSTSLEEVMAHPLFDGIEWEGL